jgi:hypothetical protein
MKMLGNIGKGGGPYFNPEDPVNRVLICIGFAILVIGFCVKGFHELTNLKSIPNQERKQQ